MIVKVETQQAQSAPDWWSDPAFGEFVGFTRVAELEWDNEPYQFNITGLWKRDSDNTLWMAHDSGCSCPTPWENTTELERVFSRDQLMVERAKRLSLNWGEPLGLTSEEWRRFLQKAQEVLGC